jgi:hypothetical protein
MKKNTQLEDKYLEHWRKKWAGNEQLLETVDNDWELFEGDLWMRLKIFVCMNGVTLFFTVEDKDADLINLGVHIILILILGNFMS